ncbi:MAG: C1 family peptidase [marine benthic group bacterium]|nr:C1 family peptidase [Candidatus Benthicola marisminoris]
MRYPARRLAGLLFALFLVPSALQGQARPEAQEREAFFDDIQAPNWLGTDIDHTPIKRQRGGSCWSFSTVAFFESEVLRTNEEVANELEEAREDLDLSEYYVVYWAYVEKAREYARRKGENARFTDGGLSHDVTWLVAEYGIVPEADFAVVEDYGAMRTELNAVLEAHEESGDWNEEAVVAEIREVLDRHLAPPPETITVAGQTMTPVEYATDYLGLDPEVYWEITSYTDMPFFGRGELDVPDNWWDFDGYYNLPLDDYMQTINQALDAGYPVVIDTDWGDKGASWNGAGLAVVHPDLLTDGVISQESRQVDFEEGRTTDDHLVLAVDHRVVDGQDWYLIKNSHGTSSGRRGYVWIRGDWMAMRVLAYMVHPDAIDDGLVERFGDDL